MTNNSIKNLLLTIVLLALIIVPFGLDSFHTEMVAKILVFAIFAMSLDLLIGFTGLISFGHAAYFGLAAYTVAIYTSNADESNLFITLALSMLSAGIAALIVGLFVLRTKGIYFIMVTLAFAQMMYFVFHDTDIGGGSDGVYVNSRPVPELFGTALFDMSEISNIYWLVLACSVLVYIFLKRMLNSPFGRTLQGIKSNEHRMQSMGYSTYWYKLGAFTIAGSLAGCAGFLYAVIFGFVTPELLSWHESGNVLLMVILGGMGNLIGAILGAAAFVLMQDMFADITEHWPLLMGSVIVFAVLFMPGGIVQLPSRIKQTLQSRSKS
ncbi:branched-chain amino acid ABC transporter permease [Limnobacter sp.]|uniref:branched-chain amino acid ABC transporter permease n=1 Tax=Limnobacter sp. TaxID=2003368 RepID=UPI0025BEA9D6|nr:branched-chain amino acid ABC transporter permease [Limnobacter sp.]